MNSLPHNEALPEFSAARGVEDNGKASQKAQGSKGRLRRRAEKEAPVCVTAKFLYGFFPGLYGQLVSARHARQRHAQEIGMVRGR